MINSSPAASPRLGPLGASPAPRPVEPGYNLFYPMLIRRLACADTDDEVGSPGASFAAAPQEGQDQILKRIGLADPDTPLPQGRGHRIKRPKVEM